MVFMTTICISVIISDKSYYNGLRSDRVFYLIQVLFSIMMGNIWKTSYA